MKRLLVLISFVLALTCSPAPAAPSQSVQSQGLPGERKVKVKNDRTIERDKSKPVRKAIEDWYARNIAAFRAKDVAAVKGKPTLLAEVGKPNFAQSAPIIMKLTLRNESDAEIYIIDSSPVRDNQLEIKNSSGEKMPWSDKAKKVLESPVLRRIVSRIGPGQVVQYEINVLDWYDLRTNGAYRVTVKRKILLKDRKKFVELESNPVKVVVQP